MRTSTGATVLLSLLLAACAGDMATEPRQVSPAHTIVAADQAESEVPILGTCVSQDAQPPVVGFPFLNQVITGTCQFSHLGRTTMYLLQRVDLRTGSSVGQVTFTAANGDALQVTQGATSTDAGPATKDFIGTATISGGTGRFANAAGALGLRGTLTFDQNGIGHAVSEYDGTISYDAADRSNR
jgi:hypothetical protein